MDYRIEADYSRVIRGPDMNAWQTVVDRRLIKPVLAIAQALPITAALRLGIAGNRLKRPQQHITDSQGNARFCEAFAEWAVNSSKEDYGWDYIVERFKDGISTGLLFSAQLKSSANTQYSADGNFISQPLELKAAEYLARQLQLPSFLFHADVNQGKLFWNAIQLDEPIRAALERSNTY